MRLPTHAVQPEFEHGELNRFGHSFYDSGLHNLFDKRGYFDGTVLQLHEHDSQLHSVDESYRTGENPHVREFSERKWGTQHGGA